MYYIMDQGQKIFSGSMDKDTLDSALEKANAMTPPPAKLIYSPHEYEDVRRFEDQKREVITDCEGQIVKANRDARDYYSYVSALSKNICIAEHDHDANIHYITWVSGGADKHPDVVYLIRIDCDKRSCKTFSTNVDGLYEFVDNAIRPHFIHSHEWGEYIDALYVD